MENKPALTAERRLAYIEDMADLETREFTMRKAVENLEETNAITRSKITNLKKALEQASKQLHQKHPYLPSKNPPVEPEKPEGYDKYLAKHKNLKSPRISAGDIVGRFFAFLGIGLGVMIIYAILFSMLGLDLIVEEIVVQKGGEDALVIFYVSLFSTISFCIIFLPYIVRYIRDRKAYYKYQPYKLAHEQYIKACAEYYSYQNNLQDYKRSELAYQNQKELYEKERQEGLLLINANNAQINRLQESIHSVHAQKQKLYALNIIPPDYREMDCVIMLHQIFRNGLKDNMADAILLYEERVYRQDIIRGIDKIYDMLGELNATMRAIEDRLIDVQHELQMIGSDMSNQLASIQDNQSRMLSEMQDASRAQEAYAAAQERWQREQLAETRASRYAAEAVQNSNRKYEWYMEQHRQGLL